MPAHARFCSECGGWVVMVAAGTAQPNDPPRAAVPDTAVEFAGTLPASQAMLAAMSLHASVPEAFAPTAPPQSATPKGVGPTTMVRTLEQGNLPASSLLRPELGSAPSGATPDGASPTPSASAFPPAPAMPFFPAGPVGPADPAGSNHPSGGLASPEPTLGEPKRARRTIADERASVAPSASVGRPSRPLGAFLVSYQYEPLGTYWPLALGDNLIGRSGSGRVDLDVGIADTTVSGEQATIVIDAGAITVEDRASRNGTSVNGQALSPRSSRLLAHGDRVRFGSFETILVVVPYPAGR